MHSWDCGTYLKWDRKNIDEWVLHELFRLEALYWVNCKTKQVKTAKLYDAKLWWLTILTKLFCGLIRFSHVFFNLFNLWSNHHDFLRWIMEDLDALLTSWCYGFLPFLILGNSYDPTIIIDEIPLHLKTELYVSRYHVVLYSYDHYVIIFTCNSC